MSVNFGAIIAILPYVLQGIELAATINKQKTDGTKVIDIVRSNAPAVIDLFSHVGGSLFPELPHPQQVAAAAIVLDPATTKRVQEAVGKYYTGPIDGIYGPATKAAVAAFQKAAGLAVDGWAGVLTQKALGVA